MRKKLFKRITAVIFAAVIAVSSVPQQFVMADEAADTAEASEDPIAPHEASYGYFVKAFKTNTTENDTVDSNATIALLDGYLDLWEPGDTWSTGKKLNSEVLDLNIATAYKISGSRTEEQDEWCYQIEFYEQNFTVLYGLGDLTQKFFDQAGIVEQYASASPNNKKNIHVTLSIIQQMRELPVSTTPAKNFFSYPRPYRWSANGIINPLSTSPYLANVVAKIAEEKAITSLDAQTDGGFPSGHTNAIFICALGVGYCVPEKFADMVLYASKMGTSRILAGMHSPLDVMGGRMTGTAFAASFLYGARAKVKKSAIEENQTYLLDDYVYAPATQADYETYKENLATYLYNMTYEFTQTGDTDQPMRVPYGAEALLESRFPYMTSDEIRYVLYTTGLPSGYPLLDDEEGWGRLNLYAAANGYGSFVNDVTVNMNAEDGGLSSCDSWMNDIDGTGSLTKTGTGTLALAGNNTYAGGTTVSGGTLVAANENALGTGAVSVNGAELSENVSGAVNMASLVTDTASTLTLNLATDADTVKVSGNAEINGKVVINLAEGYTPAAGTYTLLTADTLTADKAVIEADLGDIKGSVKVEGNAIVLTVEAEATPTPVPTATSVPTSTPEPTPVNEATATAGIPAVAIVVSIVTVAIIAVIVVLLVRKKKEN